LVKQCNSAYGTYYHEDTQKKVHSRAYHRASDAARKEGKTQAECSAAGRDAAAKAVEEWLKGQ